MIQKNISANGGLSRRSFIGAAAASAVAAAAFGMTACSNEGNTSDEARSFLPETWDYETDIAIVGYGGAGISASITCEQEGLGDFIAFDAAPAGLEGGNSRTCGQLLFIPKTVEAAVKYQKALNSPYVVEDELVQAWAENLCENFDWLEDLGADLKEYPAFSPEYPELCENEEDAKDLTVWLAHGQMGNAAAWNVLSEQTSVPVENDRRVVRLIHDPQTKEVFGCIAVDSDGKEYNIKARKGVILSCGGMENDADLRNDFAPLNGTLNCMPIGTIYNRGDGVKMCMNIGARLWHMSNMPTSEYVIKISSESPQDQAGYSFMKGNKAFINVGPDGTRFMNEEAGSLQRHGMESISGIFLETRFPQPAFMVFGQSMFDAAPLVPGPIASGYSSTAGWVEPMTNDELVEQGLMYKADTIEALAKQMMVDPAALSETVTNYNNYCADKKDPDFGRGEALVSTFAGITNATNSANVSSVGEKVVVEAFDLEPIDGPTFYAIPIFPCLINTLGGPKRGTKNEVLDMSDQPIPRLYACGELGEISPYLGNGGDNFSGAISSGRCAARAVGALDSWETKKEA